MGASKRLRTRWLQRAALALGGLVAAASGFSTAAGTVVLPDPTVCDGVNACEAESQVCQAGFQVTFEGYQPAATSTSGLASFTYLVCSPPAGTCSLDATRSCLDNDSCARQGAGVCSRTCGIDTFRGLSHYDVNFPEFGTCLSAVNEVSGSCTAVDNTPLDGHEAAVGRFVLGDASCAPGDTAVAKCDSTELAAGDCVRMTVNIAGETSGLGAGAAVAYDKASTLCTSSCLQGPSCEACDDPPDDDPCLTRTIGFWGTHPWITNDYAPVQVCGVNLGCWDAGDGSSDPSCGYGACDDVMEALGSNGGELKSNAPYVALVRQLAAAKLNLAASASFNGGTACTEVTIDGQTVAALIESCEALCGANKATITASGCIEKLDSFNNLPDVGFDVTPAPFDRPSVDDAGNVKGADPRAYTAASGDKLVVGKGSCNSAPP